MDCTTRQEQLGQLLDGEARARDQGDLFAHLGACVPCRDWFDALAAIRGATSRDREAIAGAAEEIPLPRLTRREPRRVAGPMLRIGPAWRLPVPLAAALALALLAGGALLGSRWSLVAGGAGRLAGQPRTEVVVVCSLPGVTVLP